MQTSANYYENLFQDLYRTDVLPPLFEVIYQEGVRNNHILFNPSDLKVWNSNRFRKISQKSVESASEVFASLFSCATFSEMCEKIDVVPEDERYLIYRIYLNFMEETKKIVKDRSH